LRVEMPQGNIATFQLVCLCPWNGYLSLQSQVLLASHPPPYHHHYHISLLKPILKKMKSITCLCFFIVLVSFAATEGRELTWGEMNKERCQNYAGRCLRRYSSVLHHIPWGQSWEKTCANTKASVAGYHMVPSFCEKKTVMWGIFMVPERACNGVC